MRSTMNCDREGSVATDPPGDRMTAQGFVYLSHWLDEHSPMYGNGEGLRLKQTRSIARGDTANTHHLSIPNHIGTHVDAPNHFIPDGACTSDFPASFWVFASPFLLRKSAAPNELIVLTSDELESIPEGTDLLLLKTGFERFREDPTLYCLSNPGLAPQLADDLRERRPTIRAIGIDCISITAFAHREVGRQAHHHFLRGPSPILPIEDMKLGAITHSPTQVVCLPMMVHGLDGAPVSILGLV